MINVSSDVQVSVSTCAALRARMDDGEPVFQIAELLGVAYTLYVIHDTNEKFITGFIVPEGGSSSMRSRLTYFKGFIISYNQDEEYPVANRLALNLAVQDVSRSVEIEFSA